MSRKPVRAFNPAWIGVAAAALLALAVWWALRPSGLANTAVLLARAYSEERVFDLRLPGAEQTTLQVRRGSYLRKPQSLLEAELRVHRALTGQPHNAQWLDLQARASLLELDPDSAINALTQAKDLAPGNASISADLGCSYALRAELDNRPSDSMQALEFLKEALAKDPHLAPAAFNLALVYEKLKLYNQAADAWRSYLSIDPNSAWSKEARARLDDVLKKKAEDKR